MLIRGEAPLGPSCAHVATWSSRAIFAPGVAVGANVTADYRVSVAFRSFAALALCGSMSVAAAVACGSRQTPPDPVVQTGERLRGNWLLTEFTPSETLEAPIQGLLAAQFNALVLSFDGGQMTARGPGVDVARAYRVTQALGAEFSLEIIDPSGVTYRVSAAFQQDLLRFRSHDSPFRGEGALRRTQ
jgi:hypothetical protein